MIVSSSIETQTEQGRRGYWLLHSTQQLLLKKNGLRYEQSCICYTLSHFRLDFVLLNQQKNFIGSVTENTRCRLVSGIFIWRGSGYYHDIVYHDNIYSISLSRGFSLISLSLWTLLSFECHLHLCLQAGFFVATLTVTISTLYFNTMPSRGREGFRSGHRRTERELRYRKLWQTSPHGSLALTGVWTHFSTDSCD